MSFSRPVIFRMLQAAMHLLLAVAVCSGIASAFGAPPEVSQAQGDVLTLREAIRLALSHAPDIRLVQAQAARAGEAVRETRSLNLPQLITGTGLAYNNGFPLSIEGAAPAVIQFGVSQSIFSKKNKNLILEAEESSKASRTALESARNELEARAALIYYELHQARKAPSLWAARLESARKELDLAQTLETAGKARPLDVTLARTSVSTAEQQLLVAQEQARLAETELREITGFEQGAPIQTVEPKFDTVLLNLPWDALFQRAVETNPEIQRADADLRAREFHVEAERGEKSPRLEIIGQYALFSRANSYQDFFNRFTRNNFLLGLSIQVPLFDGFRASARTAASLQEVAEARFRLARMKSDLRMGIQRSASALRIARGAAELARSEAAAAEEDLSVVRALLERGRIGSKELLASENQLREKEIGVIEADKVLFQRQVELLRLAGSIDSALLKP